MKRLTSSTLTIVLAAGLLVLAGIGVTMAATGGTFLLGKSNSASSTTSLTNSAGTALSLSSKSGTAPLKVNRNTKVTNLNADFLDGLTSTSLQRRATGSCATGIRSLGSLGTANCATPVTMYATAGAHAYTVPAGVYLLRVRVWGGGGGASLSDGLFSDPKFSGAGGGQGGYVEVLLPVEPGQVVGAAVGAGGAGESADDPGTDGDPSVITLNSVTVASAPGGHFGSQPPDQTCGHQSGGGIGGAAGTPSSPAVGLLASAGANGAGGIIDCGMLAPGGKGGGTGFAGAGATGYPSDTYFAGPAGSAGLILIEPVG